MWEPDLQEIINQPLFVFSARNDLFPRHSGTIGMKIDSQDKIIYSKTNSRMIYFSIND